MPTPCILVRGGAGVMRKLSGEKHDAYRQGLVDAARVGRDVLASGGTALEAVRRAARTLEASGSRR